MLWREDARGAALIAARHFDAAFISILLRHHDASHFLHYGYAISPLLLRRCCHFAYFSFSLFSSFHAIDIFGFDAFLMIFSLITPLHFRRCHFAFSPHY
jgi:hypothetical protein